MEKALAHHKIDTRKSSHRRCVKKAIKGGKTHIQNKRLVGTGEKKMERVESERKENERERRMRERILN